MCYKYIFNKIPYNLKISLKLHYKLRYYILGINIKYCTQILINNTQYLSTIIYTSITS